MLIEYRKQNTYDILQIMNTEARQKFNQIFQIKINETNLSKIINHFYTKLTQFEHTIASIDTKIKNEIYSEHYQSRMQYLINKQTQNKFINLNSKLNDRQNDIHRLTYSIDNYHQNQDKEIYNITQQMQELNYKMFQNSNANQMKHHQGKIIHDMLVKQTQQQKNLLESFRREVLQKFNEIYDQKSNQYTLKEEVERIQNRLIKYMDENNALLKQISYQQSIFAVKGIDLLPKDGEMIVKKSRTLQKSRASIRKSIVDCNASTNKSTLDENSIISSFHLLSQYKSLKEKVQSLESNIFILTQNSKKHQKALQRNDSIGSIELLQVPKNNIKPSRFSRVSINTNHPSQFRNEQKGYLDQNTLQIKIINEKLKKIQLKNEINDENYNNLLQKIHKLGNLQNKVQCKIQQAQKLRVELNTINEINSKFKIISSLMEIQEEKYVLQKLYSKQNEQIKKKLDQQRTLIGQMAKKQQIKQAIIFLENKIKQIVIILTKRFQEQKLGAINKIQNIKCLTCDKDSTQNTRNTKTSHFNRFNTDKIHKESLRRIRTNVNQTY